MPKVGQLVKVWGRLATVVSDSYTRMVYDEEDRELIRAGYEAGSACGFVDVVFNDNTERKAINISRNTLEYVK